MASLSSGLVLARVISVGGLLMAVATVTACGGAGSGEHPAGAFPSVERPIPPAETVIEGGSQAQRAALRDLLERLGSTGIRRLVVERPDDEWKPLTDSSVMLSITPTDERDSAAQWEAAVLAGAFDERSRVDGLPRLAAYNGPDGGSRVAQLPGQTADPSDRGHAPDVAALRAAIREAAGASGARIAGLRLAVLNSRPVAALDLRIDRPAEFLRQRLPFVLAQLPPTLDGSYVEVRNEEDERVLASGWFDAGSVAGGLLWVKSHLDSCSPVSYSEPVSAAPPACPFDGARVSVGPGVLPHRRPAGVEDIARLGADASEDVYSLAVDRRPALCRAWELEPCPGNGGRLTWLATIVRTDGSGASRWLAIDDGTGEVVGEGRPHA